MMAVLSILWSWLINSSVLQFLWETILFIIDDVLKAGNEFATCFNNVHKAYFFLFAWRDDILS